MVVDASAVISVVGAEADASEMLRTMQAHSEHLHMAPFNWLETWTKAYREKDEALLVALERFYGQLPIQIVATDATQSYIARTAYDRYGKGTGHRAKLNMGDCFAYALAKALDEPLLFKGDDFVHTDVRSAL